MTPDIASNIAQSLGLLCGMFVALLIVAALGYWETRNRKR